MFSRRLGSGRYFSGGVALALLLGTFGACAPAVGGGVLVAVVGIGALTARCYDYIDVAVFDAQGRKTCAATVTAENGGDEFELKSCYYAPLTDGHWTIRAKIPGLSDAVSAADVDHAHDCTRHVQSMELTLNAPGTAPAPRPSVVAAPSLPPPPARPTVEPGPGTLPPAGPAPVGPTPASPAPASPMPAPAAPAPAPPAGSSPPIGVFPDQDARPSPPK